ncbi:hypothetical protein Syun_008077 [Stephania yunnanensis]|uniref:SMP-30/Gluconolactonase/LRE-like region domain-containing protein n=1 Tax=Stephania yunnanensis TaxID=152371 RepID=A0AAP0KZR8_9MAGN
MVTSVFRSPKFLLLSLLISAVPLALLVSLERSVSTAHVYQYKSNGWFRESCKWDEENRRFLVSYFEGGVGEVSVSGDRRSERVLEERTVLIDADVASGNSSLGIVIDRPRNRLLVVYGDVVWNRFAALGCYDLDTWRRLFLTTLTPRPGDNEKALADDVAVDVDGNAYVGDAKSSKIWKVGVNGELLSVIRSPLFKHDKWYKNMVGLNGIVYHPDGYLLVIHTSSGTLYKIDTKSEAVKVVKLVGGSLAFGDGLELLSPTEVVVAAAAPSARLVESRDGWETAAVVGRFSGPLHRMATAATVKEGKVFVSHLVGLGFPNKKHVIVEAVFDRS